MGFSITNMHPRWFHAGGDMFRILRFGRWLRMIATHVWNATSEESNQGLQNFRALRKKYERETQEKA